MKEMEKPHDTMAARNINIIGTRTGLLSGRLNECHTYKDESCEGGIATVAAYARNLTNGEPYFVIPYMDKKSQFVQLHPLGWSVNRLVFNGQFGFKMFVGTPSLLIQNYEDYGVSKHDLSNLQSRDMPLLLTNVNVPPSNTWNEYTESVYFDETTGIALMSIANDGELMTWPHVESALGGLKYIADRNLHSGCTPSTTEKTLYDQYFEIDVMGQNNSSLKTSGGNFTMERPRCWIPVIRYWHFDPTMFNAMVKAAIEYKHPPAVIFDASGNNDNYTQPTQIGPSGVWVVSYNMDKDIYYQHRISLSNDLRRVENFELITDDLEALPTELKDEKYAQDIKFLRQLADEAEENDPLVGYGTFMPAARTDLYRRCQAGECEVGNLFTDALRWKTNTDIAFVTSGGLRGNGWPEGEIHASNIWESLPFPNLECTGTMTGVSLFKLVKYSIEINPFVSESTADGGRFIQVSGMKVTYNTNLESRVVAIDIWDKDEEKYLPIDRMRLYTFVTDSFVCAGFDPYPDLLGANGNFFIDGEKPGVIGDFLVQNVVGEYLSQLDHPYNAAIEGRLVNDTSVLTSLNLIQTEEGCHSGTYWVEEKLSCFACPNSSHVTFSDERFEFSSVEGDIVQQEGRVLLVNREIYNFSVVPRAIPSWMVFTSSKTHPNTTLTVGGAQPTLLQPGESMALDFLVGDSSLEVGTALGTVSFGILDSGTFEGCVYTQDATFDVYLRVLPGMELNHLGAGIRSVGLLLMGLTIFIALFFAVWVLMHRHTRLIRTMQPLFLVTICVGVIIAATAIVPISIDDGLVPSYGCDMACMSIPWLLSIGCTVTFSALFSKLWRVNKLFNRPQFQRVVVTEKDVLRPVMVLFSVNFILLLAWTLTDPWKWIRRSMNGQVWNTYGVCASEGTTGEVLIILAGAVNVGALLLACYQAYKAHNISKEFSEAKRLFTALYMMSQVIIVGIPVLALIDNDNVKARYFLQVGILFVLCMSMTLPIFLPTVMNAKKDDATASSSSRMSRTRISGLNLALPSVASTEGGYYPRPSVISNDGDYYKNEYSTRSLGIPSYQQKPQKSDEENGCNMSVAESAAARSCDDGSQDH